MSNNSFVTPDGREIGRAQAVQAAACRLAPRTDFNPVLIKPETDRRAQVVVNGRVAGRLEAGEFGRIRKDYWAAARDAFDRLSAEFDLVILEGAGSPAEINLREQDIVNMWMAREAQAPVLLVGDIDRGGVFAALVGTLALLQAEERRHVKAFLINKFRGDPGLVAPGVKMLEERTGLPCVGVLPYWRDLPVPQEDSLGWESAGETEPQRDDALVVGVADVPTISNATDFEALLREPDVHLIKVNGHTKRPLDALIFPGTKNTPLALKFVRARGLDRLAQRVLVDGGTVLGLCGGYQILGRKIRDPRGIESPERELDGLGLLDVVTSFARKKVLIRVTGRHRETGCPVEGYQIHMGRTRRGSSVAPLLELKKPDGQPREQPIHGDVNHRTVRHSRESGNPEPAPDSDLGKTWIPKPAPDSIRGQARKDEQDRTSVVMYSEAAQWDEGAVSADCRVWGTYVHGIFDSPLFRRMFLNRLRAVRGWPPLEPDVTHSSDLALDRLADFVERHVEIKAIEAIIEQGV